MCIRDREGVDLIILEAMSSQAEIVQAMIECSTKIEIPVWLAISCVIDNSTNDVMLGYNDSMDTPPEIYENFEKSLNKFSKLHEGPILIAHSNIDVTGKAVKIAKKNFNGIIGAYPNVGFYEKPHWIYEDNMKPEDIQTEIYTVGKNNGYKENLREWFKLIYEVVFGVENGPRLGFFISFFGRKEMISLIKEKIN